MKFYFVSFFGFGVEKKQKDESIALVFSSLGDLSPFWREN